jgi:hypothetical protein
MSPMEHLEKRAKSCERATATECTFFPSLTGGI